MTSNVIQRPWEPSLRSGYARNAAESANPGLWRGLVYHSVSQFGASGTLQDLSGHNHNGTYSNTNFSQQNGPTVQFDAVTDKITLANREYITPKYITAFYKFYPTDLTTPAYPAGITNGWADGLNLVLDYSAGGASPSGAWRWILNIGGRQDFVSGGADLAPSDFMNSWVTMVITHSGTEQRWYFNGVEPFNSPSSISGDLTWPAADLVIGDSSSGTNNAAIGHFGQCAIWDYAFTPAQVQEFLADPLAPFRLRPLVISVPAVEPPVSTSTSVVVKRHAEPSIKSGYARNAAESANPGLWRGLVGAWCPMLGNTGKLLVDAAKDNSGTVGLSDSNWRWGTNQFGMALHHDSTSNATESTASGPNVGFYGLEFTAAWAGEINAYAIHKRLWATTHTIRGTSLRMSGTATVTLNTSTNVQFLLTQNVVGSHAFICTRYKNNYHLYQDDLPPVYALAGSSESGADAFYLLTHTDGSNAADASVNALLFWNRVLTPSEIRHLSSDPLAPFRLRPLVISVPPVEPPVTTATSVVVKRHAEPSLKTGYARNAAESANPSLWRGLYAAWMPMMTDGASPTRNLIDPAVLGWSIPRNLSRTGSLGPARADPDLSFYKTVNSDAFTMPNQKFTILVNYYYTVLNTGDIFEIRTTSGAVAEPIWIWSPPTEGLFGVRIRDTADSLIVNTTQTLPGMAAYAPISAVVSLDWPNECRVLLWTPGGQLEYTDSVLGANGINQNFQSIRLGNESGDRYFYGVELWSRSLSWNEMHSVASDPLAPFRLRPLVLPIPGEEPPPVPTLLPGQQVMMVS